MPLPLGTLTDASPLVALLDKGQQAAQARCLVALPRLPAPLVSTWPCFTEAMYLLGRAAGYPGQRALWQMRASGKLVLHDASDEEASRMAVLMEKYRDTPMDLADASLVAAAEALGYTRIFTLDSDFYVYRLADGSALAVVP